MRNKKTFKVKSGERRRVALRHTLMDECTNTGNLRNVFQCLEQTRKSDHYGLWHSHDSAPQMGLYIGWAEARKKKRQELAMAL